MVVLEVVAVVSSPPAAAPSDLGSTRVSETVGMKLLRLDDEGFRNSMQHTDMTFFDSREFGRRRGRVNKRGRGGKGR